MKKLEGREILNAAARIVEMEAISFEEEASEATFELNVITYQATEEERTEVDQMYGRAQSLRDLAAKIRRLDIKSGDPDGKG